MANHQKDFLFVLIKSLSKSEKRQFKIFASRLETSSNTKFIELFVILFYFNSGEFIKYFLSQVTELFSSSYISFFHFVSSFLEKTTSSFLF